MRKKIVSLVATLAIVGLLAGPARAATSSASPTAAATHNIIAQCRMSPGIGTTHVLEGSADGWATNGSVGVGTALTCTVKDRRTGATYGSVGGGTPGPHSEVVGTVDVPPGSDPYACASASAVFSDGVVVSYNDC
jgi:hypothetical protein